MVLEAEDIGESIERDSLGRVRHARGDAAGITLRERGCANLIDGLFAEALDVHLLAPREPDDLLADLGRALGVDAIARGFERGVLFGLRRVDFDWATALGAFVGWDDL